MKYLFLSLALTAILFSCEKETIKPVAEAAEKVDLSKENNSSYRISNWSIDDVENTGSLYGPTVSVSIDFDYIHLYSSIAFYCRIEGSNAPFTKMTPSPAIATPLPSPMDVRFTPDPGIRNGCYEVIVQAAPFHVNWPYFMFVSEADFDRWYDYKHPGSNNTGFKVCLGTTSSDVIIGKDKFRN